MATVTINGRRVTIPSPGQTIEGRQIIERANARDGRRVVVQKGIDAMTIDPNRRYALVELQDKQGRPIKVGTIPDRTKGSFWGRRSEVSKRVIRAQVMDMALHCFKRGVNFDEQDANWMTVPRFVLPDIWHSIAVTTELMVVFPTEYPELPPVGFYLKADLPHGADGHLFDRAYHEAASEPLQQGWKWYCVYIQAGQWRPAPIRNADDWRRGDNLWTYFLLIKEALSAANN